MRFAIIATALYIFTIAGVLSSVRAQSMELSDIRGRWVLDIINGEQVPREPVIYFEISERDISGFDGCNDFGGNLEDPTSMRQGQRACLQNNFKLPEPILNILSRIRHARREGDSLIIPLSGGKELTFIRDNR